MRDYLAWRMTFGITTPLDQHGGAAGIRRHAPARRDQSSRPHGDPRPADRTNEDFDESIRLIDAALEPAVASVMDCRPNAFILGISALSVCGAATRNGARDLKARIRHGRGLRHSGGDRHGRGVFEALKLHGIKRRIAIMEPYFSIEPKMVGVFGAAGYEIVRYNHYARQEPDHPIRWSPRRT